METRPAVHHQDSFEIDRVNLIREFSVQWSYMDVSPTWSLVLLFLNCLITTYLIIIHCVCFVFLQDINQCCNVDGFLVLYSITDRDSYDVAADLLHHVHKHPCHHVAVILIGNKTDLVRSREVAQEGACQSGFIFSK